ncbi:hypothetical protein Tco_1202273 [Tanacetum coccineum]
MVDVPIHQEDPAVQRTLLIDTVTSMVTDKSASTPTPPTTQAQVQMCSTSCWKDSQENLESFVHIKMEMVSSCSGKDKFITACSYFTNTFKEIMKAQAYVSKASATLILHVSLEVAKEEKEIMVGMVLVVVEAVEEATIMVGHYARDCRLLKRVEENTNLVMEEEEKVDGIVMMAYEEIVEKEALMAYADDIGIDTQWYLDTAARNHMCGDKGLFLEMKEVVDGSVSFGDEAKIHVNMDVDENIRENNENGDDEVLLEAEKMTKDVKEAMTQEFMMGDLGLNHVTSRDQAMNTLTKNSEQKIAEQAQDETQN